MPPTPTPSPGGSLRRFTLEQFSNRIGIAGSKIDRALRDLVDRYNNLQPQDMGKRWVICQRVGGYSPQYGAVPGATATLPWLGVHNANTQVANLTPVLNPYRLKGTFNTDIPTPNDGNPAHGDQLAWTTSFYTDVPVRIMALNVTMVTDGTDYYVNPWVYGAAPPPNKATGQPLNDFYLDLSIDDRFYTSNRFKTEAEVRVTLADMKQFDKIGFNGSTQKVVNIDLRNLDIRVPQFSRIRLALVIPVYNTLYVSGWNTDKLGGSTHAPTQNQVYSWTLTTAEAVQ